jgi:hypothetical protein
MEILALGRTLLGDGIEREPLQIWRALLQLHIGPLDHLAMKHRDAAARRTAGTSAGAGDRQVDVTRTRLRKRCNTDVRQ